ncbi:long-chain-fatty-acid--CoA ligase [Salsuginibacillus kocurii]|uniref:long-chain-fatty-acid--CoA ligase n=1 Tax=Salsuginibacillus kocurii TaxID=427078 RepID=UPI00036734D7|nr:long-chain fatty acid--CoA ligase [Salsuginibacillus kocurii]
MGEKKWLDFYPETVPKQVDIPSITLYQLLEQAADQYPEQLAVIDGSRELTYKEVKESVDQLAASLYQKGFTKGDRLAVVLPNSAEYIITYFATMRLGGIIVQVNPLYQLDELEYLVADASPAWFVANDIQQKKWHALANSKDIRSLYVPGSEVDEAEGVNRFYSFLKEGVSTELPPEEVNPSHDVAVIQYTGGTTGRSKGVMLTHSNLLANVEQSFAFSDGFLQVPGERMLSVTPFFHVYGMTGAMNLTIFAAGTIICQKRFQVEETLELMRKHRPTFFPGVPTMYMALLQHPASTPDLLSSLKVCNSGSAPMPVERMKEFERKTGSTIVEGYGLSEAAPITHRNPVTGLKKAGSIGIPIPNTDSKIVDRETGTVELQAGEVGELIIKGPQVMKGYWNKQEETAQTLRNGWLFTGDLAKTDEDGYFYIVGRKKDMIIASGYNVYPTEIEEVLYQHEAVKEVCVFGVPDPYRGETVKAAIVLTEGAARSAEDITKWCSKRIAAYKIPKHILFRNELPKTVVGKVLRYKLIEEERENETAN